MITTIVLLFALPAIGQGCPHEGADHRLLGHVGCQIQRKMTIERARPPRTIWSFRVLKLSVKIDPRHPHLLVEWPARSQKLWRFRVGYRWDANAKAYIFPALALKKVDGPMAEYQRDAGRRIEEEPVGTMGMGKIGRQAFLFTIPSWSPVNPLTKTKRKRKPVRFVRGDSHTFG
jgi:hypothetical protein